MIESNSGKTWDQTLKCKFNLYTSLQQESILIDYGDSNQEFIVLNSSNIFLIFDIIFKSYFSFLDFSSSYLIPENIVNSSIFTSSDTSFLILNNEFHNQSSLFGFEYFGAQAGLINLKVIF